ncbi:unnamed protein product [Xylocopa violacea]|uniref:Cuticle protein 6 n=1 Tax=Xylocopa violacea TaxID=135666 RepID=A0ABP1NDT1_XYLVO
MQSLIPLVLALSLASGAQLNLLPYAYLSGPLSVYNQYQNTRTGEHAFSYAGGPSAKEEIKGPDGVLRGSYSYVDANGDIQSAFYVADDGGFRVAATNLPTDSNVEAEAAHILLARSTRAAENANISRKRRSLENSVAQTGQEQAQNREKREQQDSTKATAAPLVISNNFGQQGTANQNQVVEANSKARSVDLAKAEAKDKPVDLQSILPAQAILGELPILARAPTYHENRIELHKELGIEGPRPKDAVKIDPEPLTILPHSSVALPVASTVISQQVPQPVIAQKALTVIPATRIGTASVTTSISSHGVSQIHGPSAIAKETVAVIPGVIAKQSIPIAVEKKEIPIATPAIIKDAQSLIPIANDAIKLGAATVATAVSSQGISQIHSDSKLNIDPTLLVKTAPIAQLHAIYNVPVYFV